MVGPLPWTREQGAQASPSHSAAEGVLAPAALRVKTVGQVEGSRGQRAHLGCLLVSERGLDFSLGSLRQLCQLCFVTSSWVSIPRHKQLEGWPTPIATPIAVGGWREVM